MPKAETTNLRDIFINGERHAWLLSPHGPKLVVASTTGNWRYAQTGTSLADDHYQFKAQVIQKPENIYG